MLVRLWKRFHHAGVAMTITNGWCYGLRSMVLLNTLSALAQALVIGLRLPAMGMYVVAVNLSRMLNLFQSAIVTVLSKAAAVQLKKWLLLSGALYV